MSARRCRSRSASAALITGKLDDTWIRTTRRWAIFSWFFLTLGNMFGARWAYEVLGWGGYWAWDPVENAAFMPWLVMTAYLHSVMIQERKDMLKVWNLALIGLAFFLTLFGTFITRSGVISSVHSFTQSGLGPYFLTFLILVALVYTAALLYRVRDLRSPAEFESYLSREAAFLFNNLHPGRDRVRGFLGHDFPGALGSGARRQDHRRAAILQSRQRTARARPHLSDGRRAADRMAPDDGEESRNSFRRARDHRRYHRPRVVRARVTQWYVLTAISLVAFVAGTIAVEFGRGVSARRHMVHETTPRALVNLVSKNNRRYGGYIIHIGVILAFVGIVGSSFFRVEVKKSVKPGESFAVGPYRASIRDADSARTRRIWRARAPRSK